MEDKEHGFEAYVQVVAHDRVGPTVAIEVADGQKALERKRAFDASLESPGRPCEVRGEARRASVVDDHIAEAVAVDVSDDQIHRSAVGGEIVGHLPAQASTWGAEPDGQINLTRLGPSGITEPAQQDVQMAIAVQVDQSNEVRGGCFGQVHEPAKSSVPIAEHDCQVVALPGRERDVDVAIAIDVAEGEGVR